MGLSKSGKALAQIMKSNLRCMCKDDLCYCQRHIHLKLNVINYVSVVPGNAYWNIYCISLIMLKRFSR